jgi:hypothetical protein
MATRIEVNAIVSTNLNTTSNTITAVEHRTVEKAVLDYTAGRILEWGYFSIGDVNPGIRSYWDVTLAQPLLDDNYIVIGNIRGFSGNASDDNDVLWCITAKSRTGFTVFVGEFTGDDQSVQFEWMTISTQGILLTTTV